MVVSQLGTQILELGILEMEIGVTVDKLCYHNLRRDCLDSGGGGPGDGKAARSAWRAARLHGAGSDQASHCRRDPAPARASGNGGNEGQV